MTAGRSRPNTGQGRPAHPWAAGDFRNLTDGVSELKLEFGPGYRAYYTKCGDRLLLLLAGGSKVTQTRDIERAITLARAYQE